MLHQRHLFKLGFTTGLPKEFLISGHTYVELTKGLVPIGIYKDLDFIYQQKQEILDSVKNQKRGVFQQSEPSSLVRIRMNGRYILNKLSI